MTQIVLGPSGSKRRRRRLLLLTTLTAAAFAVFFVAASSANLPSSGSFQFEDNDGNLVAANSGGTYDWNGPTPDPIDCGTHAQIPHAGVNCGTDLFKDIDPGHLDNALGQGTKEDDFNPVQVVSGTIPPSKDDLSRFYINKQKQTIPGDPKPHTFLYLAWERTDTNGSAHLDFEFNQETVGDLTTPGPKTLNRKAGDLLIDYDFGGSGVPVLALHRWITTGNPTTDCEVSNTLPCWDKAVELPPGTAEGQVNNTNVQDTNPPDNPRTLPGSVKNGTVQSTFGEAGIDLTAANVFPANKCFHLGGAWVKSRSSGNSFGSELKDFIAPIPINISNCGDIKIIKQTDPRGVNQDFGFTSDIPDAGGTAAPDETCASDTTPASFTLNDNGNAGKTLGSSDPSQNSAGNTEACTNIPQGTYHVSEDATLPNGFAFESLTCTGGSTTTSGATATIVLSPGDSVTCIYVNQQQLGAIKISKTSSKTGNGLAGAQFSITKGGTPIAGSPFTTGPGGTVCVDNLAFGDYVVTETQPPTGFSADDTTGHTVTVDNNAKCSDDPYVGESIPFTDTPLADIQVRFRDGGSGETHLTTGTPLSCNNATGTSSSADTADWDDTLTVTGVKVTSTTVVVTCTISIDP